MAHPTEKPSKGLIYGAAKQALDGARNPQLSAIDPGIGHRGMQLRIIACLILRRGPGRNKLVVGIFSSSPMAVGNRQASRPNRTVPFEGVSLPFYTASSR